MNPSIARVHLVLSALTLIAVLFLGFRHLQLERKQTELRNQLGQLDEQQAALSAEVIPLDEQTPKAYHFEPLPDQRFAELEEAVEKLSKDDEERLRTRIAKEVAMGYPPFREESWTPRIAPGKVRFIRLQYDGGDWNQDMGVGSDLNMLIEYSLRTKMAGAKQTESRTIARLKNFKPTSAPPFVYLTGQKNIKLSQAEVEILRTYLLEKGGMIFGDNGGSTLFHEQFLAMMKRVLPDIHPVIVPLDDPIHTRPYKLPFLPYVALHGGKNALGWKDSKLDRWLCYYHPGDLGDAWSDGHAGVEKHISEACYQLGVNVIFYSFSQNNKHRIRLQDNSPIDLPPKESSDQTIDNLLDSP